VKGADPLPENKVPWSLLEALLLWMVVFLLATLLGSLIMTLTGAEPLTGFLLSTVLNTALIFLGVWLILRRRQEGFGRLGLFDRQWRRHLIEGLGWGIPVFVLVMAASTVSVLFNPVPPPPQDFALLVLGAGDWQQLGLVLLLGSVLAPAGEELYFRGFLYPALKKHLGPVAGMILTSLFFGSMHFDLARLLPLALGGLALNWLYERTGSLYVPLAAHGAWNALMVLVLLFSGGTIS